MTPQSLYRRYRPQRFGELVGQEHVTAALGNAVRDERVGHAYLFSGPRGTGKTTTARILAKALNCLDPGTEGEPCGTCGNCTAIAEGTFFDLAELDAASNNGVDNVRDLIQSVNLGLGASARRKVYIIDEVHMLSAAASNALLKTLEEPPEHVVFVLATTDPQKVLPTIRSRTQHFEFTLLDTADLARHLAAVLDQEGVTAEPEALDVVARRAAGSARDALSILDQALALGGGTIDAARVTAVFGDTPFVHRMAVLEAVAGEDAGTALREVAAALAAGIDPRRLADDLLRTLRDAFLTATSRGSVPYDGPADEATRVAALAETLGAPALTRGIETLGQAIVDIRGPATPDPRLVLEVAVVRLARRESRTAVDTLLDRVERLERDLAVLRDAPRPASAGPPLVAEVPRAGGPHLVARAASPAPSPAPTTSPSAGVPDVPTPPGTDDGGPEHEPPGDGPAAADGTPLDLDAVIEAWPAALGAISAPVRASIEAAQPIGVEGPAIVFGVPPTRYEAINRRFRAEADTIKRVLADELGRVPAFKLRPHDFGAHDALRPVTGVPAPSGPSDPDVASAEPDVEEEAIDPDELVDAEDAGPLDPAARLMEAFPGATIVEERVNEQR